MGGYYFKCHLYFNSKIRVEFEVVVDERVLCELMVLLENKKEVILKKLFIILQYLSCIFKHLLEVILMLVQKLNETVVA